MLVPLPSFIRTHFLGKPLPIVDIILLRFHGKLSQRNRWSRWIGCRYCLALGVQVSFGVRIRYSGFLF